MLAQRADIGFLALDPFTDPAGRKTALAATLAARGSIELFQSLQQPLNAGWVPFAVPRRWYLSLVQLMRDGVR